MASDLADLVRRRGASPESLAEVIARSYGYRGDTESYDDLQQILGYRGAIPDDDAGIAGWSANGLATRLRAFELSGADPGGTESNLRSRRVRAGKINAWMAIQARLRGRGAAILCSPRRKPHARIEDCERPR